MNIRIIKETRSFCHLGDREWAREKPNGPKGDLRGCCKGPGQEKWLCSYMGPGKVSPRNHLCKTKNSCLMVPDVTHCGS